MSLPSGFTELVGILMGHWDLSIGLDSIVYIIYELNFEVSEVSKNKFKLVTLYPVMSTCAWHKAL